MGEGIYTRGFLPHWDFERSTQAITFRLADSVPAEAIKHWNQELDTIPDSTIREKELHRRIASYEDAGNGNAVLKNPNCAAVIQGKLIEGHSLRYLLIDWCIMPNLDHLHDCIAYIRNNPVRAGLCDKPEDWPFSSAGVNWNGALSSAGPKL